MKKIIIAILAFAAFLPNAFAQGKYGADSAECIKYLSYYKEYFKQKNYDEAIPNWRMAYKLCPATANQSMFVDGTTLLRKLIVKNQRNVAYKNALIDSLLTLSDVRAEFYPKYAVTALNNKGLDLNNYVKNDYAKLFQGYEQIIEANQTETKNTILLFDLNAAIELYKGMELSTEDILKVYQRNIALIDQIPAKTDYDIEQNAKVKSDLENLFISSKVASCDDLIALFGPRYEANPEDLQLATNIVKMMSVTEDCISNDLYLNAVTTMYKLDPSSSSAYFLYKLHSSKGNVNDAIGYLEEAIAFEDTEKDAEYSYELAAFCFKNGRSAKAYEIATKVPAMDQAFAGKAYFLIGTIWGGTRCGGNEITSHAGAWVAMDYFAKAKAADPSLAEEADKYIANYSRYSVDVGDAFMYGYSKGQAITVTCGGMTATTTIRMR